MSDLETWKQEKGYSNPDILSQKYLERIKLEPALVACACGCGQLRRKFDKQGIERHYILGHQSQGRKPSAESIQKGIETKQRNRERNQPEIIRKIYDSLPINKFETIRNIAKKAGISRDVCRRNLELINLIFSLQSKNWLEIAAPGRPSHKFYRRKPKRSEKVRAEGRFPE